MGTSHLPYLRLCATSSHLPYLRLCATLSHLPNLSQALRNIINSSCDQPIGYPIYVSPLMTSFVETSDQISGIVGGPISFGWVKRRLLAAWQRLCARCGEGCVSGGSVLQDDGVRYIAHPCTVQMGERRPAHLLEWHQMGIGI